MMTPITDPAALHERLKWNPDGLIPAIVQDATSKQVLMMAWMNRDALAQTLQIGETVFWSRSRQALWHKGETSGNVQHVRELYVDCDADVLLVLVDADGAACHTGEISCFFRTADEFSTTDKPYV